MRSILLRIAATVLLIGSGLLAGCNSAAPATTGLSIELIRFERDAHGNATAVVRYMNPNMVAYNIARVRHEITVGGLRFDVKVDRPLGVPAQSNSATQTLQLETNRTGASLPHSGDMIPYEIESQLALRIYGEDTRDFKIRGSGQVRLQ